jgi:hypothetical protein
MIAVIGLDWIGLNRIELKVMRCLDLLAVVVRWVVPTVPKVRGVRNARKVVYPFRIGKQYLDF